MTTRCYKPGISGAFPGKTIVLKDVVLALLLFLISNIDTNTNHNLELSFTDDTRINKKIQAVKGRLQTEIMSSGEPMTTTCS